MTTGTQQQHDRRGSDPRIEKLLEGNEKILELLGKREVADALLEQRVEIVEIEVWGKDREGGIKAQVAKHEERITLAIGGMAVLTAVGGLVGWCADKVIKAANR